MVAKRENPYGAFNFLVSFGNETLEGAAGGFSDVSGLSNEIKYSEYRNGNEPNHVRKIGNINSTDNVTLKRGMVADVELFDWLKRTRDGAYEPKTVRITLLDEARSSVCTWVLGNAQPQKWVGPTLAAKAGGEVAMEELHLVAETIDFEPQ